MSRGKLIGGSNTAHCDGYAWDLKSLLGKGSYGNVYRGTNNARNVEVAVKVVRKDIFKQDPKAESNLMREIDMLKKLRACEYVVHLYHVQDMQRSDAIVLVMELCEYDLEHLIKVKPFEDRDTVVFLHQLGEGMKALRAHNIVHRDIKPGNILIKYHHKTGKVMYKLADFGFARHFTDELMKPLNLQSLAGTPVYMAPEALRCVFSPGVEHYDDKVDLFSIGALLYKVLVGTCGFYAQLNHILQILEKKGDAIAWEPSTAPNYVPVPRVKYFYELPPSVDERLSPPFKQKMNQLLVSLLKLDPLERMTYPEFFDFTDDLIKSKVEVLDLLHGTSVKFMVETGMKMEDLCERIMSTFNVPMEDQIVFSAQSDLHISKYSQLTQNDFNLFLNRAGGSQGHAILYLLPMNHINAKLIEPDYGVMAKLYYCVENRANCVHLITERKHGDDIVHSIGTLQKQIERQFECIQEFRSFCTKQLQILHGSLGDTHDKAKETLAKTTLAVEWLEIDLKSASSGGAFDQRAVGTFQNHVDLIKRHQNQFEMYVQDVEGKLKNCEQLILNAPSLEINDLIENSKKLTLEAKQISSHRKDFIYQKCEELLQYCKGLIVASSERAHKMLKALCLALSDVWSVQEKLQMMKNKKEELEKILSTNVPQWKVELFRSAKGSSAGSQDLVALQAELASKNETIKRMESEHHSTAGGDSKALPDTGGFVMKLKAFCSSAKQFIDPTANKGGTSPAGTNTMYPNLGGDTHGIIADPMVSLGELLPEASLHLDKLQEKLKGAVNDGFAQVKVAFFENYSVGDVVMFHPVGSGPGHVYLNLLHLKKPNPYALLHSECYGDYNFRLGRVADLVIGSVTRLPEEQSFKDHPELAKNLGQIEGSERKFYWIWAKPAGVDFIRRGHRPPSTLGGAQPPPRPQQKPTTPTTGGKQKGFV